MEDRCFFLQSRWSPTCKKESYVSMEEPAAHGLELAATGPCGDGTSPRILP
jgi:hypothetical protein